MATVPKDIQAAEQVAQAVRFVRVCFAPIAAVSALVATLSGAVEVTG